MDNKTNNKISAVYWMITVWASIGIFLAFMQVYLMFGRMYYVLPLFLIAILLFNYFFKKFMNLIQNKNGKAIIFAYVFSGVHFIPLILQLLRFSSPGPDNLLTALIGLWFFYVLEDIRI